MHVLLLVSPDDTLHRLFGQCAHRLSHASVAVGQVRRAQRMLSRLRVDLLCLDTMLAEAELEHFSGWLTADAARESIPVLYVAPRIAQLIPSVLPITFRPERDGSIARPIEADALSGEIERLLREAGAPAGPPELLEAGQLLLNLRTYQLCFPDGSTVLLTPTEFRLIRFLMERIGQFVHPEDIVQQVWGYRPDPGGLAVVRAHVANVRRKLRQAGRDPNLLRSVPYRGYSLAAEPAGLTR